MRTRGLSGVVCSMLLFAVTVSVSCGGGGGSAPALPEAPQNVSARGWDGEVTLTWSAVAGAYSYNIYTNTTGSVTTSDTVILNATMPYESIIR